MAKFSCEVDSEAKTIKFFVDGNEISVEQASVGFYKYMNQENETEKYCYASFTKKDAENTATTVNIAFELDGDYTTSSSSPNTIQDISKAVARLIASDKLATVLAKKKCAVSKDGKQTMMDKKKNMMMKKEEMAQ